MSRNEPKISSHKGCSQYATERRRGVSLVRQLILFSDGSAEVRFLEAFLWSYVALDCVIILRVALRSFPSTILVGVVAVFFIGSVSLNFY